MLSVTDAAKEKLKDDLQGEKESEETLIRIAPSSGDPQQLGFFLDTEKEGDQIISDNEGLNLLLIGKNMAAVLSEAILDYGETDQGMKFTLT